MAGIVSLASVLSGGTLFQKTNKKRQGAYFYELAEDGSPVDPIYSFQYYPDSITDTKAVNWSTKDIPGSSLPIYQWISSGAREIAFTAVLTCDNDLLDTEAIENNLWARLDDMGEGQKNIDIRTAIILLRKFMLPAYSKEPGAVGVPLAYAPRKIRLLMPGTGIGLSGGESEVISFVNPDELSAIMLQCDVTYVSQFPSGLPRIAEVQLSFAQTAQYNGSKVDFPNRGSMNGSKLESQMDFVVKGYSPQFYPYKLIHSKK